MPRGSSPKREREYKELERRFEQSGRYGGRSKEVAARIVNKQRARFGETKQARSGSSAKKTTPRKTKTASGKAKARKTSARKTSTRKTSASRSRSSRGGR